MCGFKNSLKNILPALIFIFAIGCSGGKSSISVLPSDANFEQTDSTDVVIDILFVIDDSGSMAKAQEELQNNFIDFIDRFYDKGFDFRVAVAKTSAYGTTTAGEGGKTVKEFRCGYGNNCGGTQTTRVCSNGGTSVVTTDGNGEPGLDTDHILWSTGLYGLSKGEMIEKFIENANVGICGDGDERGIQSAKEVLDNQSTGHDFPRAGAHLAVIHIGDENDGENPPEYYSSNSGSGSLSLSGFSTLNAYKTDLESRGADGVSVHAIQVTGEPGCRGSEDNDGTNDGWYAGDYPGSPLHSVASRGHNQFLLAALTTGGMNISMCEPFADSLSDLGNNIASLASAFILPVELDSTGRDTLEVYVQANPPSGTFAPVPKNGTNGFSFDIGTNSIVFHGSAIPPQGAQIGVRYTCEMIGCNGPWSP